MAHPPSARASKVRRKKRKKVAKKQSKPKGRETAAALIQGTARRRWRKKDGAATKIAAVALGRAVRQSKKAALDKGFRWPQSQLGRVLGRATMIPKPTSTTKTSKRPANVRRLALPGSQSEWSLPYRSLDPTDPSQASVRSTSSASLLSAASIASNLARRRRERAEQRSSRSWSLSPEKIGK
jgi:hypothetical protein